MLLGTLEFVPFEAGMFDNKEQAAIFIFKHTKSNNHYACRYWDAKRYTGAECYPMSLANFLKRVPSEVEVYVLPMNARSRKAGEALMDKVVDLLVTAGLYRSIPSRTRGGVSVIRQETSDVILLVHSETGIINYTVVPKVAETSIAAAKRKLCLELNDVALDQKASTDVKTIFAKQFHPFNESDWSAVVLPESKNIPSHQMQHQIEVVSVKALREGKCVINRIRTHSPLWYFNNQFVGKNITAEQYIELGSRGMLAKDRRLQHP